MTDEHTYSSLNHSFPSPTPPYPTPTLTLSSACGKQHNFFFLTYTSKIGTYKIINLDL